MVSFTKDYSTFSSTQQYQHAKLFRIMKKELGDYEPKKILDVGCGDGKQTLFIARQYPKAKVIGIDVSNELIDRARKLKNSVNVKNIDFFKKDYFDFKETGFDVVYSNNVFHWFGDRAKEGYFKLSYHLVFGGYFFIHQGGKWSYIALRCIMEKLLKEKGIKPPAYNLFYPTRAKMEKLLEGCGFSNFTIHKEIEHEVENKQVYIDFTYAGGLPYLERVPEKEREKFRIEFIKRCIEEECPALPVRLYIWGRNTNTYPEIVHAKENTIPLYKEEIQDILIEVDNEFIPYLSSRISTTDMNLSSVDNSRGIKPYLQSLMQQEFLLAIEASGRIAGFLSFIRDYEFLNRKWVYVSTIAVRKIARGLGLGKALYRELIMLFPHKPILTRTWTGNQEHLNLLISLGFKEIKRLKNHRGKGIDTIYLGRL